MIISPICFHTGSDVYLFGFLSVFTNIKQLLDPPTFWPSLLGFVNLQAEMRRSVDSASPAPLLSGAVLFEAALVIRWPFIIGTVYDVLGRLLLFCYDNAPVHA
ncbi:hypothetical protein Y032_0475g2122 [Ancylostoma ceylanicum]|uniref:Uncharacterized protein n=1 Tax=Ancylostoma ceylanicum TaxID=53326 RepID=A0A016WW06_9BILA|nr:hypothetical protein Y032_0475g2122 [Ancylostoma ceylanicum]